MSWTEFISQIYWRPRIGDASFMGWLTVAAYGLTAILCLMAALRQNSGSGGSKAAGVAAAEDKGARLQRRLWLGMSAVMFLLCLNKQLDLQSLLTNIGRIVANQGGWYERRRTIQFWFVVAVGLASIAAFVFLAWKTRSVFRGRTFLLLGLSMLLLFVVMRAASFHHVGVFLERRVLGLKLNWILELGSIALVAFSAGQAIRRPRPD
jgi:hypothetical protein